ncbi:MAG: alpha/beta hydrolase, partial [Chloroflexi bacterium]|nr:alpha/beta hydrolase [Chloroflexota bacterium]
KMTEVFNGMFLPDANDEIRNEVVKGAISIPKDIGIEVYRAARTYENEGLKANLKALDIPKFAINSSELVDTDLDAAKKYGVEVWPIKGVGHFVMLDDPEGFNAILDEILDQISEKENNVGG